MPIPNLILKATTEALVATRHAKKELNIPDNINDLKMWIDCKTQGSKCEVTNEEALLYIESIINAVDNADRSLIHSISWLEAIVKN